MITTDKASDELARIEELYRQLLIHFRKLAEERSLTPEELFRYADAQRKAGNIQEAVRLFSICGDTEPTGTKAIFFADRLSGLDIVAPSCLSQRPCPAPLISLPNFLGADERRQVQHFFLEHENQFVPARFNFNEYDAKVRNNLELAGSQSIKPPFREKVANALPQILQRMGVAPFPVKKIEVKLRLYQNGQYFRIHTDSNQGRRLTFTWYLRETRYEGGHLIVFDTMANGENHSHDFTRIIPEDNCLYCFPSSYFHAVTPVRSGSDDSRSERVAINGHVSERL